MDIHGLYESAGKLHGHLCPGLAIGVRAAAEAQARLGSVSGCTLGHRACWVDGIRSVLGVEPAVDETDTAVFDFFGADGGALRMTLRDLPHGADKAALIERILFAPADDFFEIC